MTATMTDQTTGTGYALRGGETWFLYLAVKPQGSHYEQTLGAEYTVYAVWDTGEREEGEPVNDNSYEKRGWWQFDGLDAPPDCIEYQRKPTRIVTGYRIADDFKHLGSEKYPAEVDTDWMRSYTDEDGLIYDPSVKAMYESVYGQKTYEPEKIIGPFTRLDGEPPPRDGRTYQAKLPSFLTYRTEYLHLFPGRLLGFHEAVKARLEGLSDLKVDFYTHGRTPSVFVKVPGGNSIIYHSDNYQCPDSIAGANRADAAVKWDAKLDEIEADVRSKAEVCSCCAGTGLPPHKRNPPKKGRRRR